jgi:hypothetical protein
MLPLPVAMAWSDTLEMIHIVARCNDPEIFKPGLTWKFQAKQKVKILGLGTPQLWNDLQTEYTCEAKKSCENPCIDVLIDDNTSLLIY